MISEMNRRCGILDFQIGACHDQVPFDPAEYIRASSGAGIQNIVLTCKDAYGLAYYESHLVEKNAVIQGDYLNQALAAGKEFKIGIYAYYNILLDDIIAGQFPQYRMIDSNGDPVIAYDYYKILCPNSPYGAIILDRIIDLVRRYDIQGMFMDITYFQPDTCHCPYCRERFEQQYGYPLPSKPVSGTGELRDFYAFRRKSRYDLLSGLVREIRRIRDVAIIWNGSGSYALAENEIDQQSDCLTSEFHAPDFIDGLIRAKWMQGRDIPYAMSTPYELGSWGDWSLLPQACLQAISSLVAANGGGLFVNHVPYPSGQFAGSVNESVLACIKAVFDRARSLESWLLNACSVPDIAVIYSLESARLFEWAGGSLLTFTYRQAVAGAVKMLLEGGRHFDILTEETFRKKAHEYHTLVLAGTVCIQEETADVIRAFVTGGGALLAAGPAGLYRSDGRRLNNFTLSDLFGADYQGESAYTVDYLYDLHGRISCGIPNNPILVNKAGAKALRITPRGKAESWASLVEPLFEADINRHVYHQHAHPARRSGYPAILMNRLGQGACLYLAPELFVSFFATGSPWLREIFLNGLNAIGKMTIRLDAPTCLHVSLLRQENHWLVYLVNVSGARFDGSKLFMLQMIPVHDVKIRLARQAAKVYSIPDGADLPFTWNNAETIITVPEVLDSKTIAVAFFDGAEAVPEDNMCK